MSETGGSSKGHATQGGSSQQGISQIDPGRKYGTCGLNNTNKWMCIFYMKETNGGISRLKHHLVGSSTSVTAGQTYPKNVKVDMMDYAVKKAQEREAQTMRYEPILNDHDGEEDVESELTQKANPNKRKKRGPLDNFVTSTPPDILKGSKDMKRVLGACDKDLRDKVCSGIARWFYDEGLPFNAVTYPSFKEMMELIGQYGMGLKPPSLHELRLPLLQKEVANTHTMLL